MQWVDRARNETRATQQSRLTQLRRRARSASRHVTGDEDAVAGTSEVQNAQRCAATGMSLRHCGHSRVSGLGSSVGSTLRRRISAVSGTTTAKNTTVATIRNAAARRETTRT